MKRIHFSLCLRQSLKIRITLFTLTVFLFCIWSFALYTSNYLRQDMQDMLIYQEVTIVSLLAEEVNEQLKIRLEALNNMSQQISSTTVANPMVVQKLLEQQVVLQTFFNAGIFATGVDGVAIADVPIVKGRIGVSYLDRDSIKIALEEGKTTISKPLIGKVLKTPVFYMATPLHGTDGKIIGALVGVIDLSMPNFLDQITQYHFGKTGGYFVVAPQYRLIVTATDKTRVMEKYPDPGVLPSVDRFLRQGYKGGSSVYVNPRGVQVLGSAKPIPISGWLMGAILPTAEAFAPIYSMQRRMVVSAIFVTLLASILTWLILKKQFAPILVAKKTLDTQSDTNRPTKPLPISNHDEIGRLISRFNDLLEILTQREKTLQESERKYRSILENLIDGFWLVDRQGRLMEANESYCRMSGYSLQELLNMHVSDLDAVENAAEVHTRIQRNIVLGSERFETVHRRKDGSFFDVEISAQFLPEGEGKGMVFLRDITIMKQTEKEFRLVFEQSRDAVIWTDFDTGNIIKANAKAEELTKRSREELIGRKHTCLFPPEQDGKALFRQATSIAKGEIFEGLVFTRSGSRIPVHISPSIVDLGSKRVVQWIFHDISELKRVQNALKASEERNRYIIDTSLEGIWIGDGAYRTTYVNHRFAQMLGYSRDEMLGRSAEDFVVPEELSDHLHQVEIRKSGQEQIYERCMLKRDGEKIWTIVSARGIYNSHRQFVGSFGMFTDITARKQAEDALRTSLLEKEILLKEVHHRVKNNLAAIMGLIDIQIPSIDSDLQKNVLTDLGARIRSMSLVHEQLYRSQNYAQINFQAYLETLVLSLESSYADNRNIHMTVEANGIKMGIDSAIPCGLIVTELVTNAYKYAFPMGHPHAGANHCEVSVSLKKDGDIYKLTVTDNGIGLPADLDWHETETLGLLLVKMLGQHELQGQIEVDCNGGTKFQLSFLSKCENLAMEIADTLH